MIFYKYVAYATLILLFLLYDESVKKAAGKIKEIERWIKKCFVFNVNRPQGVQDVQEIEEFAERIL